MRYLFILAVIVFVSRINSGCNKFEDGNNFSIRTVKGRLIKGSPWIFEKLEVNGVDKSAEFVADSAYFNELSFNKVHELVSDEFSFDLVANYYILFGQFSLSEDHSSILITTTGVGDANGNMVYYSYGPIFTLYVTSWKMTRLTMKELQMKTNYNGIEYKLFLKSADQ